MSDHDRGLERLRRANPAPTRPVEGRPTAQAMLAAIQRRAIPRRTPEPEGPRQWRRGLVIAAAAFAAMILFTIPILLVIDSGSEDPPAATDPTVSTTVVVTTTLPTTAPSTTVPPTTVPASTVPTTTVRAAIDPATQQLVDTFVATYNSGDVDAFAALLHPDFRREITRERALEPQPLDTVLILYEVDAALNAEITLDCVPGTEALACEVMRSDDLHLVLGIGPTADRRWLLTFRDGRLLAWAETRQNFAVEYEAEAIAPFLTWIRENRPEVQSPYPFTDGDWVIRDGIANEVATLVREWANSLGVILED